MPTIIPNQKFKHDGEVYEEGKSYDVSPELAFYFKTVGWLGEKAAPTGEAVTLDVHNSTLGQTSKVN